MQDTLGLKNHTGKCFPECKSDHSCKRSLLGHSDNHSLNNYLLGIWYEPSALC